MSVKYYTEDEFNAKSKTEYALRNTLYQFLHYFSNKDKDKLIKNRKSMFSNEEMDKIYMKGVSSNIGRYAFIPQSILSITEMGIALGYIKKRIFKEYKKDKFSILKFIDAGCGIGWIPHYLKYLCDSNIKFYGVELDEDNVEIAESMETYRIIHGDILDFDFKDFDFIYYYCPLENTILQRKFEERLEDTCKVGAIILPYLKKSKKIEKDKRFKHKYVNIPKTACLNSSGRYYYWQKVKE